MRHLSATKITTARPRLAFTLIELLVVISLIALLIGILLPALASARTAANATLCLSRMRQISIGYLIYAIDNKGIGVPGRMAKIGAKTDPANLYPVGNGMQYRPRWFIAMGASANFYAYKIPSTDPADDNTKTVDSDVFVCPQVPDRINNRNYAYGYNFQFLGNTRNKVSGSGPINFPVKVEFVQGSQTVLAADCLGTAAGKATTARTPYQVDGSKNVSALSNHGWALDPPRLTANSDYCDNDNRAPQHRSAPDERHLGAANISFVDGHGKRMTRKELGYTDNADGSVAANGGGGAHNRQFSGNGRDEDPPDIN